MVSQSQSSSSPRVLRWRSQCHAVRSEAGAAMRPTRLPRTAARCAPDRPSCSSRDGGRSCRMAHRATCSTPTERGRTSSRESTSTRGRAADGSSAPSAGAAGPTGGDAGLHQLGGAALGLVLDRGAAGPELGGALGARMRSTRAHSAGPSPRGRATWRPRLRRVRWLACGRALVARESVRKAAERCGVAPSTAFRWRHRCVAQAGEPGVPLAGLVEADETCFRHSRKGERNLNRKPRRRGGPARRRGLSREPVPVRVATARGGGTAGAVLETASQANLQAALEPLLASDAVLVTDDGTGPPGCARSLGGLHEAVNRAAGQRVRGSHPIQTVNQRHRQLQQFLLPFHGVADEVPRQLPALASGDRSGQPALPAGLPARLLGTPMHTFRELSQNQRLAAQNTPNSARIAPRLANLG